MVIVYDINCFNSKLLCFNSNIIRSTRNNVRYCSSAAVFEWICEYQSINHHSNREWYRFHNISIAAYGIVLASNLSPSLNWYLVFRILCFLNSFSVPACWITSMSSWNALITQKNEWNDKITLNIQCVTIGKLEYVRSIFYKH